MRIFGAIIALLAVFALPVAAGADYDCSDFASHTEAQDYFESQGGNSFNNVDRLDADGDGLACEWGKGSTSSISTSRTTSEEAGDAYYDYMDDQYAEEDPYDPYLEGDGVESSATIFDIALLPFKYPIILLGFLVLAVIGKLFGDDNNFNR